MERRQRRPGKAGLAESSRRTIERVLADSGWESLAEMTPDDWENVDMDALRDLLGDEQFQALLDEIAEGGSRERDSDEMA